MTSQDKSMTGIYLHLRRPSINKFDSSIDTKIDDNMLLYFMHKFLQLEYLCQEIYSIATPDHLPNVISELINHTSSVISKLMKYAAKITESHLINNPVVGNELVAIAIKIYWYSSSCSLKELQHTYELNCKGFITMTELITNFIRLTLSR
jgi:hypothetical protein